MFWGGGEDEFSSVIIMAGNTESLAAGLLCQ